MTILTSPFSNSLESIFVLLVARLVQKNQSVVGLVFALGMWTRFTLAIFSSPLVLLIMSYRKVLQSAVWGI